MSPRDHTSGVVAPTTDMFSLVLMESPYPLIPRAQPIGGVMMNPNQDEFDNGGRGLAYSLFSLNLLR